MVHGGGPCGVPRRGGCGRAAGCQRRGLPAAQLVAGLEDGDEGGEDAQLCLVVVDAVGGAGRLDDLEEGGLLLTVSQELDQPTPRIGQVFTYGIFLCHTYTQEYGFIESNWRPS